VISTVITLPGTVLLVVRYQVPGTTSTRYLVVLVVVPYIVLLLVVRVRVPGIPQKEIDLRNFVFLFKKIL